jgi:hypothetical protein
MLAEEILKMRKNAAELRCTVNRPAPGPLIVRFLSINYSPLVRLIVVIPAAKLIVSPGDASRIACRSDPAPLSLALVTVMVAACAAAALKSKALVTNARKDRLMHPPNLRLLLIGNCFLIDVLIFLRARNRGGFYMVRESYRALFSALATFHGSAS